MRVFLPAILVSWLVCSVPAIAASPQAVTLTVCNNTNGVVSIAVLYGATMSELQGWYAVQPGKCELTGPKMANPGAFGVYAITASGPLWTFKANAGSPSGSPFNASIDACVDSQHTFHYLSSRGYQASGACVTGAAPVTFGLIANFPGNAYTLNIGF